MTTKQLFLRNVADAFRRKEVALLLFGVSGMAATYSHRFHLRGGGADSITFAMRSNIKVTLWPGMDAEALAFAITQLEPSDFDSISSITIRGLSVPSGKKRAQPTSFTFKADISGNLICIECGLVSDIDLMQAKARHGFMMNADLNLGGYASPKELVAAVLTHNINPAFTGWDRMNWVKTGSTEADVTGVDDYVEVAGVVDAVLASELDKVVANSN